MRKKIFDIILTLAIIGLCSCADMLPIIQNPFENKDGNFILYVSNQSYEIRSVDIYVTIDGSPVLHEYFKVGNQHAWKRFVLQIPSGKHRIKALTRRGHATIEQPFEVTGRHWAILDFCYGKQESDKCNKPSLTFEIFDRPIGFL